MRIDHHAYQKATNVAAIGLLIQSIFGLLLLLFGLMAGDTPSLMASYYVLTGVLLWLGLIIVFHQHKLERLEALEEDELAATRGNAGAFFDRAADETRVAARRLAQMHKWLMPGLSLAIAACLGGLAWLMLRSMRGVYSTSDPREFELTEERGWAIAIFLGIAAFSFIFSRFVAGMAKQQAWQNLRGGAAYMVGNALVMLAIAVGVIFRFFDNQQVIKAICYALPIFMAALALEIVLNFVLNMYRPRIPGEVPRPAFDSKALSLFATPDSIVRSLNEAVNYQFGFDVTSSWGYQLLLRSFVSLLLLGAAAMILLSTMVIVEPHQQAVKLRFGQIIDDRVYQSGVMWKWPWPIETADIHDVTRLRQVYLTAKVLEQQDRPPEQRVYLWDKHDPVKTDVDLLPFIVGSPRVSVDPAVVPAAMNSTTEIEAATLESVEMSTEEQAAAAVSDFYSLVDAEIILQYRIRQDEQNGLLNYLRFAPETVSRRQVMTDRERALRALALAEVSRHFSRLSLDDVLASGRTNLEGDLRGRIQRLFDERQTGVEVVALAMPMLRPSGEAAPSFEELNVSAQARQQRIADARRNVFKMYTYHLGDASLTEQVIAAIDEYNAARASLGTESPEVLAKRQAVVDLLHQGRGTASHEITNAEKDRWMTVMTKRLQAERLRSELAAYQAAPELYRQRETMRVYRKYLPFMDKFIIAIDPAQLSVDIDLKKISPILEFAGASEEEKKKR